MFLVCSSEWWLVFITALLAVFTGLMWKATVNLAKEAKATSDQQRQDTKDALVIAKQSAEAANKNAEALQSSEKAYVFLESAEMLRVTHLATNTLSVFTNQIRLVIKVTFKNHGKTPAILKELFPDVRICEYEDVIFKSSMPFSLGKVISASGTWEQEINFDVDNADYEKARVSDTVESPIPVNLQLFGSVLYKDIMENERKTEFCWKYDFKNKQFTYNFESAHNSST